ncbi:MAG: hypothetical protein AAB933_03220 [Patescibacteria group bacterium]
MRFIFDFDDVLFHNTKKFKEHMYICLEKAGVSRSMAEEYYKKIPKSEFWLKKMLTHFSIKESFYEEILKESKNFLDKELVNIVKKIGKENCFIVSHGYEEWQLDKIKKTGINLLFREVIIVQGSKKEAVEKIAEKYKDEEVVFIDDQAKHFENLDFKKYPNLKTILFDEKGLEKLISIFLQS